MVEWNGGVDWWNGGVVEWWNGGGMVVEWRWNGGVVEDQLIIYPAICGGRAPSKIIWIRQTGAHTLDENKKNVMNHQVIDIL